MPRAKKVVASETDRNKADEICATCAKVLVEIGKTPQWGVSVVSTYVNGRTVYDVVLWRN